MLATSDPSFTRFWYLTVDKDVDDIRPEYVEKLIAKVLSDPAGWARMGYEFMQISEKDARRMDPRSVLRIRVSQPRLISRKCGINDRSCADLNANVIYLNSDRWLHGAEHANMTMTEYRKALIAHEVGHLLSFDHVECSGPGQMGDVMQEFTLKGWQGCRPSRQPTLKTRPTIGRR